MTGAPLFKPMPLEAFKESPFRLLSSDWMLITAGAPEDFNTMTASWGGFGVLWERPICFCVVRPSRYTFQFMEKSEYFTLSFFEERYRKALELCGTRSGRDLNKAQAAGLTPQAGVLPGLTRFAEARLVMECRKLYYHDLAPQRFLEPELENFYPEHDYHRMYVGELVQLLRREG